MINRWIARYVIRKTWHFVKTPDSPGYGTLGERFNILSTITTALGGDSSWFPKDVSKDFMDECVSRGIIKYHSLKKG